LPDFNILLDPLILDALS